MKRSTFFWLPLVMACSGAAAGMDSDCADDSCIDSPFEEAKSALARDTSPAVSDAAKTQVVADNTDFAVDLLTHVARPDQNQLHSPHSISTCLSMVYAGARGSTRTEMAGALHFGLPDDQLHAAFDWLDLAVEGGAVHMANVLFGASDLTFEAPFLDTLAVSYGAGIQLVDFRDPSTKGEINGWIADRTAQRIPQVLVELDPATKFAFVNTIHLESAWASPFSPLGDAEFTTPGGIKNAPFMRRTDALRYRSDELGQVVELNLHDGLVFDVVLPAGDLAAYEATLTGESLRARWPIAPEPVDLRLPKLELKPGAESSLVDTLKELGMPTAFTSAADLSGMTSLAGLRLDQAVHQTFLKLDEEGVEAAAATVATGNGDAGASLPPANPAVMNVNRPFLLAIRHERTGALLFLGHVVDPT